MVLKKILLYIKMFRNLWVVYECDWKWSCIHNKTIIDYSLLNTLIAEGTFSAFYRASDEYKGV